MDEQSEVAQLREALKKEWGHIQPDKKAAGYIGAFFSAERRSSKLIAQVKGNHGTYTVSIALEKDGGLRRACSCYIGRHGYCHHVLALAHTFLRNESSFTVIETPPPKPGASPMDDATNFDALRRSLRDTALESLLLQLREAGITQKAFAEALGMKPSMLTVYKSSEARHHYFNELGAVKLACVWMLQHARKRKWKMS